MDTAKKLREELAALEQQAQECKIKAERIEGAMQMVRHLLAWSEAEAAAEEATEAPAEEQKPDAPATS
jgi:hypothetical protein